MVLDPVTAFAVAGNVLQFLQIGTQFAVKATTICLAGKDGLSELRELHQLTLDLDLSLQQLETPSKASQISSELSLTASEARLAGLSKDCSKLAQELITALDKIGIHDKGGRLDTILTSFRAYFNSAWIDRLTARIDVHRQQLATALVVSMRFVVTCLYLDAQHQNAKLLLQKPCHPLSDQAGRDSATAHSDENGHEWPNNDLCGSSRAWS